MTNEEKILNKLERHDKRFDAHDKQLDMIVSKLAEHDGRFDELATKKEFNDLKDQVLEGQDAIMTILQNLQQEIPSISQAVTRHDKDIAKIKEVLKIV